MVRVSPLLVLILKVIPLKLSLDMVANSPGDNVSHARCLDVFVAFEDACKVAYVVHVKKKFASQN